MEQLVTIVNSDPRKPLRLISIASSSSEFQASWFKHPVVAPGENTTFTVAFLGHALGEIEANMTLLTSQGEVVYEVRHRDGWVCRVKPYLVYHRPSPSASLSVLITGCTSLPSRYQLFANSLDNPLRLRPLIYGRIPIKLRLAQTVHVYNPYPEPLLVGDLCSMPIPVFVLSPIIIDYHRASTLCHAIACR
jgi:hypothetical protein